MGFKFNGLKYLSEKTLMISHSPADRFPYGVGYDPAGWF
jgi:hypothetical protein